MILPERTGSPPAGSLEAFIRGSIPLAKIQASYERIGNVRRAQGELDAALQAYQESLAIRERLARQSPDDLPAIPALMHRRP